jgi:hypothetical protein
MHWVQQQQQQQQQQQEGLAPLSGLSYAEHACCSHCYATAGLQHACCS